MPPAHNLSSSGNNSTPEGRIVDFFLTNGWTVEAHSEMPNGPDIVIHQGAKRFVVEVKSLSEGRPDRVLPLLSMAILQARAAAEQDGHARPLAVVDVPAASPSLMSQVQRFAEQFAKDVAVGVISREGELYFSDKGLQKLNHLPDRTRRSASPSSLSANLFSDLNQWMLKLLLAPDLPPELLSAPPKVFRSGAELAVAAGASAMSASRFLQQLRHEGFLGESSHHLQLVRREELFRRWSAAALRPCPELPCRFLLRVPAAQQIHRLLAKLPEQACLGLFAAADELGIGHVSGVPAYIYVRKLPQIGVGDWSALSPQPAERPDLILRQASFPKSTFRGALHRNGVLVSDVIQVWLDVTNHPSRGAEQADLIYKKFISRLIKGLP